MIIIDECRTIFALQKPSDSTSQLYYKEGKKSQDKYLQACYKRQHLDKNGIYYFYKFQYFIFIMT